MEIKEVGVKAATYAVLPVTLEILSIASFTGIFMQFTSLEALLLGTILSGVDSCLISSKTAKFKMEELSDRNVLWLVDDWAALETSYVLLLFTLLSKMPEDGGSIDLWSSLWTFGATIFAGILLGGLTGYILTTFRRRDETSRDEACWILFSMIWLCKAVARSFSLVPEVLVIIFAASFLRFADRCDPAQDITDGVLSTFTTLCTLAQLVFFCILGNRMVNDKASWYLGLQILPMMLLSVSARFLGILLASVWTRRTEVVQRNLMVCNTQEKAWLSDTFFSFFASLPRATIQGALGSVAITSRLFSQRFESITATYMSFYMISFSLVGSILLESCGRKALRYSWPAVNAVQEPPSDSESEPGPEIPLLASRPRSASHLSQICLQKQTKRRRQNLSPHFALDDPNALKNALLYADIRPVRLAFLEWLHEENLPLPRRQEAEAKYGDDALVTPEEIQGLTYNWRCKRFFDEGNLACIFVAIFCD